ncbi:MAG: ABC transporter permease [Blastocatellia bacterium]
MQTLWQDLRYGLRMLRRNPGFTIAAALSLALGIGANTAIFSVVNAALLRPLPVKEPDRLVGLYRKIPQDRNHNRFSYPNYLDTRDRNQSFSGLAAYYFTPLNLSGGGQTERLWGKVVSGNYFSTLGVEFAQGRTFLPEEDRTPGAHPVAVVSHGLWQRRFGGDPNLVGKTVTLNGYGFTIVGIAPAGFRGTELGMAPDVWVPMMMQAQALPGQDWLTPRGVGWLRVVGRLKPGVSWLQAQAEMEMLGAQLKREHPEVNEAFGIAVVPDFGIHPDMRGDARNFLLVLMGVVGLVLLIACANTANLLLARASERRKEIGIRLALGARRGRLIGQLLTESLMLSLLGAVISLLLTPWISSGLEALQQTGQALPTVVSFSLDERVLGFTALVALLTGVIFGLAPAIHASKTDVIGTLKDTAASRESSKSRLRQVFVVSQLALSLVLLIAAGLFIRSLRQAQRIDPGFRTENVLLVSFDLGLQGYNVERGRAFYQQLEQRVGSLPGVEQVSLADTTPLTTDADTTIVIDGYTPPTGLEGVVINYSVVSPNYFQTLGIPLPRGRSFSLQDHPDAPRVVILNETAARRFWPGQDALGKRVGLGRSVSAEVIGIARDGKYVTLGEDPRPYIYFPMTQNYQSSAVLQVRTAGDPAPMIAAVQREARALDKDLPTFGVRTMKESLRGSLAAPRLAATFLGAFGAMALLLAMVGIYGVMAYAVSQRTREIGIRVALGAERRDILKLVLKQSLKLIVVGLLIGLAGALAATRLLESFLYGVSVNDPATFIAVPLLLASVALLASCIPARRATKVDPIVALRCE